MNQARTTNKKNSLSALPSVDELLRSEAGRAWLEDYPRSLVLSSIRKILDSVRSGLIAENKDTAAETGDIELMISESLSLLSRPRLRPVINATGVILHTNLGRSPLPPSVLENILNVARGYSNLEFDLEKGERGKRYSHLRDVLREITGAEDAIVVNNNASAVLLCLSALAAGREVIVSRGELIEIGGAFRIPDVMKAGGARLVEVGTTNKTHPGDYESAISDETALLLKVHPSNYRIVGFVRETPVEALVSIGRKRGLPVMYDLGSGSIIDLAVHGIPGEPTVRSVVEAGADLITFSGDKLLGGPQGGLIVGRQELIKKIQAHPLTRAVRVDKLTLAGLEATLSLYRDEAAATKEIPVLSMLTASPAELKSRARRLAGRIRKTVKQDLEVTVMEDVSRAGGGSLPEVGMKTMVVALRPARISVSALEERLRTGTVPVIARIREDMLLLDVRTIMEHEMGPLVTALSKALGEAG